MRLITLKPKYELTEGVNANVIINRKAIYTEYDIPTLYLDGIYLVKYKLSWLERLSVLFTGNIFFSTKADEFPMFDITTEIPSIKPFDDTAF